MLLVQVGRFNFADFMGQKLRERKIKKYTNRVVLFFIIFFFQTHPHTHYKPQHQQQQHQKTLVS